VKCSEEYLDFEAEMDWRSNDIAAPKLIFSGALVALPALRLMAGSDAFPKS
jgi:hypothetical protein